MIDQVLDRLLWLGRDCFLYNGPQRIYFNPYEIHRPEPADIILVGHEHMHHCSLVDIDRVRRPDTIVVCDQSAGRKIDPPVLALKPGETAEVEGILIEAVPAYNLHTSFHPKRNGYLGFIVTLEGERVYHAGDTDFIPEMRDLQVDIALLPVSGTHVMNPEEAAQAALALKPKVAIPTHYGMLDADMSLGECFRGALAGKLRVEILAKS
jgi:L-ascorbate metabolism protein UlaG (beta-lactamase superfamily)